MTSNYSEQYILNCTLLVKSMKRQIVERIVCRWASTRSSYLQNFVGILNVVNIGVVMLQVWVELLKAEPKFALLQMSQQCPDDKEYMYKTHKERPSVYLVTCPLGALKPYHDLFWPSC